MDGYDGWDWTEGCTRAPRPSGNLTGAAFILYSSSGGVFAAAASERDYCPATCASSRTSPACKQYNSMLFSNRSKIFFFSGRAMLVQYTYITALCSSSLLPLLQSTVLPSNFSHNPTTVALTSTPWRSSICFSLAQVRYMFHWSDYSLVG